MAGKYTCGAIKKLELKADKDAAGKLQWREMNNVVRYCVFVMFTQRSH